jgi:hypothetical protein
MLQSLRNLGQRKPSKKSLQESVAEALEKSPLAQDRGRLDKEAKMGGETQSSASEAKGDG